MASLVPHVGSAVLQALVKRGGESQLGRVPRVASGPCVPTDRCTHTHAHTHPGAGRRHGQPFCGGCKVIPGC